MSNANEFIIENGVLKKYVGPGGSVVIPEGVATIGWRAFAECRELMSIVIPEGVTKIESFAFAECIHLTNVEIGQDVSEIRAYAFQQCESLSQIDIPEKVRKIGDLAFEKCGKLTCRIAGQPTVGERAFDDVVCVIAPGLPVEAFPQKTKPTLGFLGNVGAYTDSDIANTYAQYAVRRRKQILSEVFLKDLAMALHFFAENKKITAANYQKDYFIPATEAHADHCIAFLLDWKDKNLKVQDVENELEKELQKDPYNVTDMKLLWDFETKSDGSITLTSYKGKEKEVTVPPRIGRNTVKTLGETALSSRDKNGKPKAKYLRSLMAITTVRISDGIKTIQCNALGACENLQHIDIPKSVTRIHESAFPYAILKTLTIHAPAGSSAEKYAKKLGISFVAE